MDEIRALPHNQNAEAAALSAMVIDRDACVIGLDKLKEEFFYRTANKIVFRVMHDLFVENKAIDAITLIDRLERDNLLDKVGGVPYLNELLSVVVSAVNFEYHSAIVIEQAMLRQLVIASHGIIESVYKAQKPVADLCGDAEQAIMAISSCTITQPLISISESLAVTMQRIELVNSQGKPTGISTGYVDLDKLLGGLRKGELTILASRPAMGKSAFAFNMALWQAMSGLNVIFDSLEMEHTGLTVRALAKEAKVNLYAMTHGLHLSDQTFVEIASASDRMWKAKLYIDESATQTPVTVRARARRFIAEHGSLDALYIDYLQLMSPASHKKNSNREQDVSDISRSLKTIAKELGIPIIALSQLGRGVEQRENKRPQLADLRESGAIEQDADNVIGIYRDEYYHPITSKNPTDSPNIAELIVLKQRQGATGTIELQFDAKTVSFRDLISEGYYDDAF